MLCLSSGDRPLFRTRITTCNAYRVETGPYFVPGLPHVVAHSSQAEAAAEAKRKAEAKAAEEARQRVTALGATIQGGQCLDGMGRWDLQRHPTG